MIEEILRNFWSPNWWQSSAIPYAGRHMAKQYWDLRGRHDLMDADWDNLLLLDGCRFDMFQEHNSIDGTLSKVISVGSATPEFLQETISGRNFYDTVYVTANPQYRALGIEGAFHATIDVWDDGWDSELGTVRPETMAEATANAHDRYPDKRILAHFMQPHYPFIGVEAERIGAHSGYTKTRDLVLNGDGNRDTATVWQRLDAGEIAVEDVRAAYIDNLAVALPHIEELVESVDGKTIVTSDHGNLIDEDVFYSPCRSGHPNQVHTSSLIEVPWLEVSSDRRKSIIAESPEENLTPNEKVTDRLQDLGYAQPEEPE